LPVAQRRIEERDLRAMQEAIERLCGAALEV
jgi:hypothetical protein